MACSPIDNHCRSRQSSQDEQPRHKQGFKAIHGKIELEPVSPDMGILLCAYRHRGPQRVSSRFAVRPAVGPLILGRVQPSPADQGRVNISFKYSAEMIKWMNSRTGGSDRDCGMNARRPDLEFYHRSSSPATTPTCRTVLVDVHWTIYIHL